MTAIESDIQQKALRRYRPYPAYKDSGVEWLGEIPEHWEVKPLKAVSALQTGLTLGKEYQESSLVTRPYLRVANVQDGYISLDDVAEVSLPEKDSSRYELRFGDVLMTEGGDYDKLGRGCVWENQVQHCLHQNHIFAVRPRPSHLIPEFLSLTMGSSYGKAYFTATSKQSTNLASTNSTKLRNFPFPLPGESEQNAIAIFLNRETARIDALVAKKQRLIELLQEQRTALITRAVTKGLDGSVPMKESGVEWLGEIPADWEVKKIKRLCLVRRGASPRPIEDQVYFDDEGEYAWVRIADVTASERYLEETTQRLSELGRSKSVPLDPGELFVSIAGTVGKPIITRIKCCIHDGFVYFVYLRESREYLYYLFSCGEPYKGLGKLGTQLNLNTDTIGDIYLPRPSMVEQERIVSYLDAEAAKINALIGKVLDAITKLGELRAALISAAVTGKIDVREEVR
jgi:type I restriction enzyme S subunit